jgi:hypothetical protein
MDIEISNSDITGVPADLLVMKYADGFHGADRTVANAIGFTSGVAKGQALFVETNKLLAPEVLFIGVGDMLAFRYEEIQLFGSRAVALSRQHNKPIKHLALTIHGPGYGLDSEQSFLSMIAGIISEWTLSKSHLTKVTVAEISARRCELLNKLLQKQQHEFGLVQGTQWFSLPWPTPSSPNDRTGTGSNVIQFGELRNRSRDYSLLCRSRKNSLMHLKSASVKRQRPMDLFVNDLIWNISPAMSWPR